MAVEIPLKRKYTEPKSRGSNKPQYSGNSGTSTKNKRVPLGMRKKIKPGAKRYS